MRKNNELFKRIKEYSEAKYDLSEMESRLWDEFGSTRACIVLDSTGFTRISMEKGVPFFLTLIVQMRDIAFDIIKAGNGLNIRSEADNIYAEFLSIEDALKASFKLHEALEKSGLWLNELEKYQVCIGIGYGKLLLAGEDGVFGDEMNIASKLGEDTANGGETLLSENAFNSLGNVEKIKYEKREISVSNVQLVYYSCYPNLP